MRSLLFLFLAACTAQAGAPAGEPPPATSPAAIPDVTVQRSTVAIDPVRDHHTAAVIETTTGPYLYVIGGTDAWASLHEDIQRAKISEDGSLGPFEPAGRLPGPRAGHCTVKTKNKLYVLGGVVAGTKMGPSASTVVLTVDDAGAVVGTAPGPALPKAVMHLTCELAGDSVYVLGGRGTDSRSTTMSARARIGADGALSPFEATTPLSPDRSHHASFVRNGKLYLVGGLTGDPTSGATDRTDIVFADIRASGELGEWTPAGSLPKALSVSAAQVYQDALFIPGGLADGAKFTDEIRRGTFLPDGTVSELETLSAKLPSARGHVHQIPVYKSFFYSVGGKDNREKSLGVVDVGSFHE